MAIVTLACELVSPGPEIAARLAGRLRYHHVDHRDIRSLARRLRLAAGSGDGVGPRRSRLEHFEADHRGYVASIRAALCACGEHDDVVLMDPGGDSVLWGVPHVLRVAIVAPVPRDLYDVVISPEKVSSSAAVDLLSALVRRPELATTAAGVQLVRDRALASRVELGLAANATTQRYEIGVEVTGGVVRLRADEVVDEAVEVAREITGVRQVVMHVRPMSLSA
jgi:hypothetical protein